MALPLLALFGVAGCEPPKAKVVKNPRVIVTTPIVDTVIDYQDFTGRLEAIKSIEIRPRVSGYVIDANFKEGEIVEKDHVLYRIEEKPYKVEFDQAEANLKLAIADRNLASKNADRARKMYREKAMSAEDYERDLALFEKAVAQVGAVEAMKEKTIVFLNYTKVKAPFRGRVSRRFVDPGNLVNADATILTTLVSEDPMYAYFDVDERTYLNLLASVAPGQKSWNEGMRLPVLMRLANDGDFDKVGEVDFVDNRVTANTGTVKMRGVFQNPTGNLKAGLFLRIRLPTNDPYQAVLIPDEAIQSDQERKFVWVVNSKNEAEYRAVKLGQSIREKEKTKDGQAKDLRVILPPAKGKEGKEGLALGDRVIISGMQRVKGGVAVDAEDQTPPEPPRMPLVRLLRKENAKR
jgi:RND family efflux transporter MFP subunit